MNKLLANLIILLSCCFPFYCLAQTPLETIVDSANQRKINLYSETCNKFRGGWPVEVMSKGFLRIYTFVKDNGSLQTGCFKFNTQSGYFEFIEYDTQKLTALNLDPLRNIQPSTPQPQNIQTQASPLDIFMDGIKNARPTSNAPQSGGRFDLTPEVTKGNNNFDLPGRGIQPSQSDNRSKNCTTTLYGNMASTTCN